MRACVLCACSGQMLCFPSEVGLVSRCRVHGCSWQSAICKATVCPSGQQNLWVTQLLRTAELPSWKLSLASSECTRCGPLPNTGGIYNPSVTPGSPSFFLCMTSPSVSIQNENLRIGFPTPSPHPFVLTLLLCVSSICWL